MNQMKPFTIYHTMSESFQGQQEKLVFLIREVAAPDMIYLLGASLHRRRRESIFCPEAPSSLHFEDYVFLVLISNEENKALHEWQDKIEQHCSSIMTTTTIVLETAIFNEWLKVGHRFARMVYSSSVCLYNGRRVSLNKPGSYDDVTEKKALERNYKDGLNKSKEFLASTELSRVRVQYKMAAFMLHQAAEQALRTLVQTGTGFHCNTHNLDRMIRYGSMVSFQLPDVFPQKTENEKRLFNLLQKAYVDARYKESYSIDFADLMILIERVTRIKDILMDIRPIHAHE